LSVTKAELAGPTTGRSISPVRVVLVTAGLAGAGGVAGAVVAMATFTLLAWATNGPVFDLVAYLVTGIVGAACGVVLGPAVAWLLLRSVPLGKAILQTSIGAAIGGVLGWVFPTWGLLGMLGFAGLGAVLAAVRLRLSPRGT